MPISRSMRALVLERHSRPFILTEAELPTITAGQVLVRLAEKGSHLRLLCRLRFAGRDRAGHRRLDGGVGLRSGARSRIIPMSHSTWRTSPCEATSCRTVPATGREAGRARGRGVCSGCRAAPCRCRMDREGI
jgi:hypothetical protein